MFDEMIEIKICKYCNQKEYYGKFTWLNGKCLCRECYIHEYENIYKKPYKWQDKNYTQDEIVTLNR